MEQTIFRVFTHHFSVGNIQKPMRSVVRKFSNWFDEYESVEIGGQWERQWKKTFALPSHETDPEKAALTDWEHPDLEYRFHINALPYLKNLLVQEGFREEDVKFVIEPLYEPVKINFKIKEGWAPFDEQVDILDQAIRPDPISKLLGLQTGGGKSALSLFTAAHWGYRAVYFMKPGYIDKWVDDIRKQMDMPIEEISTIFGLGNLSEFIRQLDLGLIEPSIILVSNATFRLWISEQNALPPGELVPGFPCEPWEFMQYVGAGFRVIDEVHEDFHFNFLLDLHTHVEQSLSLSATLISRNEYLMKMYKMAYPESSRIKVPDYVKFVKSISYMYEISDNVRLKTSARGRTSYSHVEFEKSILHSRKLTRQYLNMVMDTMKKTYFFERRKGERCLVYFATKKMCEEAVSYFRQAWPDLVIKKFNMGDPLKNATESDICCATLKKAGTAIDIPMLTTVILTVAIDSIQSNLQSLGRLRNLKKLYKSDRVPVFVYYCCTNNRKHLAYHRAKKDMLKQKAAFMSSMHHQITLGVN